MEKTKGSLLVAWDFSQVASYALDHACIFARNMNAKVQLLHVVKKEGQIEDAVNKLNEIAEKASIKSDIEVTALVKVGSIFTTINEVAKEESAELVLMGTHGIKGMQKFTGSWALKVIVGSRIPFVVVQDAPKKETYDTVVLPIDFKKENKEKLSWAELMGKLFKAKMRIVTPETSESITLQRTKANLIFAQKYLESRGVDYEIDTVDCKDDFAIETIDFAKNIEADLILIMTTKNISFQDYVLGANEQYVIANTANIPVMCVNPRTDLTKYGSFF
jgi:nucleotide-binding universal stress UspA family protein